MSIDTDVIEQQIRAALDTGDYDAVNRLGKHLDQYDQDRARRLHDSAALAAAALWYADQGIAVFPLHPPGPCDKPDHDEEPPEIPEGKRPYKHTRGFKDATTDPEQIHRWWKARPGSNIGTPTGHAFDVIDVDGPAGNAFIYGELHDKLPPILGWVSTPRRGGRHLYVPASGQGNKTSKSLGYPGIDYRGAGGYVVLPPSVGANGELYRWVRPLNQPARENAA